ncbi:MAG: hypothetical protein LUQ07_03535, partial [Methanospirillum sp.]|nr:hypothetical protein [Methanospirillum sp.]
MALFNIMHRNNIVRDQILEDDTEAFNELFKIDCFNAMDSPDAEDDMPVKPVATKISMNQESQPEPQVIAQADEPHPGNTTIQQQSYEETKISVPAVSPPRKKETRNPDEEQPRDTRESPVRSIRTFESVPPVPKEVFSHPEIWNHPDMTLIPQAERIRTFEP